MHGPVRAGGAPLIPERGNPMLVNHRWTTVRRLLVAATAVVLVPGLSAAIPASPAIAAPGPSFTNPLVGTPNSADPSIAYSSGNWYYVATTWSSRIVMRR